MIVKLLQAFLPCFLGAVSGLYWFQVFNAPNPAFTKKECAVIATALSIGALIASTVNRFAR